MQKHPKISLIEHFKNLADPRGNRTKDHDLIDVLLLALCPLLGAGESFNDMEDFGKAKQDWFKTFLSLRNGIPWHDTFNGVLAALDPTQFLECLLAWTQSVGQAVGQEIVALEGKALRRAFNQDQSVKYIVSAWAEGNGLVLGQLKVAHKSNEITAVPQLWRVLELSGCIVTIDAMGCQKKIAQEIIAADADYVLALQGHQQTVPEEVKTFLDATLAALAGGQALQSSRPSGDDGNGGKRPRADGNPPLFSERGTGLVCRSAQRGGSSIGGPGPSDPGGAGQNHP